MKKGGSDHTSTFALLCLDFGLLFVQNLQYIVVTLCFLSLPQFVIVIFISMCSVRSKDIINIMRSLGTGAYKFEANALWLDMQLFRISAIFLH